MRYANFSVFCNEFICRLLTHKGERKNMENQKSAIGLDGNLAAAIGYPIGIIALILVFIEKENKFVRFHAIQSLIWSLLCSIVWTIVFMLGFAFVFGGAIAGAASGVSALGFIGLLGYLFFLIAFVLGFAWLAALILAAVKAYGGNKIMLPISGKLAEKWSR
jgi:uncharacterized membrane protein